MKRTIGLCLVAVVVLLCGLTMCGKKPLPVPTEDSPVLSVTVGSPRMQELTNVVHASGSIHPWQETILQAEVSGLEISAVYVNVGDSVHKGDKLAKLNGASVQSEITQYIANLAEAKALFEQAQIDAKQAHRLEKVGAISKQDLLSYTTKEKSSEAKLKSAQAALTIERLKLGHTLIIAPDDGVISVCNATLGSITQNGSELFRLVRSNRLEWQAQVGVEHLDKIKPGQTATLQVKDGQKITGVVSRLSPSLNQTTRNGIVYVDLPATSHLKIGAYLSGVIEIDIRPSLVVPTSALIHRDGYHYVMRLDAKNHAIQTKVKTGDYLDKDVVILAGLSVADKLVTLGAGFLNQGDLVRVVQETPV